MERANARDVRDVEFERYEFGDGVTVEDFSGWETCGGDSSMKVFVRVDEADPEEPTTALTFAVKVDGEGQVVSAEASDAKGQVWGRRGNQKDG